MKGASIKLHNYSFADYLDNPEAQRIIRELVDDMCRKSWRTRRLLEFSPSYIIPKRTDRNIARARREALSEVILSKATDPEKVEWVKRNLARRGRPFKFDADFILKVDAFIDRLAYGHSISPSLQVHTHRIFRLPNRAGSIKRAIEQYLANNLGRLPTAREIANAQAVYSQRSRRS